MKPQDDGYMFLAGAALENARASQSDYMKQFRLSELFSMFSDTTRIRILYALSACEMCVRDLSLLLNMTQSAVSHQLALLKRGRLVKARREGKVMFYSLADSHVRTILSQGMDHINE